MGPGPRQTTVKKLVHFLLCTRVTGTTFQPFSHLPGAISATVAVGGLLSIPNLGMTAIRSYSDVYVLPALPAEEASRIFPNYPTSSMFGPKGAKDEFRWMVTVSEEVFDGFLALLDDVNLKRELSKRARIGFCTSPEEVLPGGIMDICLQRAP
jgi:hypothetical protein